MKEIKIYMEGGGDGADEHQQKAELRNGMDVLLDPQKQAARHKRLGWKLIPCGGRDQAFDAFRHACLQADDETLVILLVDSEDAIAPETKDADANANTRVQHLKQRAAHWDFSDVDRQQVHLMVRIMEAWIVSDPEAMSTYYGNGFHAGSLPNRHNLEDEPKPDLLDKLKKATRNTQKGEYAKIKHASKLLERIDRTQVAQHCARFATFTPWLTKMIAGA